MSNIYYSAIGILAVIIHLIINHGYYLNNDTHNEVRAYKNYLSVILLYFLTDVAWGFLSEFENIQLLYIDTILYYITMAFSVVFCCRYIIAFLSLNKLLGKILNACGMAFAFGEIVILAINHFHHIFFWFDESGEYEAFSLRHYALAIQIFMFGFISVTSLIVALRQKNLFQNRNTTISMFGFCMTFALCAQYLYPLLPLYSIGLMLGTLIIHVFIHNEEQSKQMKKIEELNSRMMTEHKALQEQNDELASAFSVISGLSHDYHTIWLADKKTKEIKLMRAPGKGVIKESLSKALQFADCDDAMQMYIDNFVCDEDKERMRKHVNFKNVVEQLSKKDFFAINYLRKNPNGENDYNQMVFANTSSDDNEQQFVFGFRDVNDILKQELALRQELSEAKEAAEAANAAKTSFLFNMSHDIRTPMNAIIGFRDLLEKNQEDAEKRQSYLEKIEESSNVLLSIINNVLEMARIEKGTLQLDESAWSTEQLSDSIYSVFTDMMSQKGLEFTREIDVIHHYIYCDPTKMREIFFNIISNAYKYTKPGGKVHMLFKELPSDRDGYAKYQTTISDTGIGMTEEFLPHLFEEFARESNTTLSKVEGTGLGMPIVKRLVEFLGGTIEVESKKDVGSTFTVTLYHRLAEKENLLQPEKEAQPADFANKRILLAEDNELNAEIAIAILSEFGFEVERAVDGQDCIDMLTKAEDGYYNLILMDIQMPRMNGYEATRAIRALDDKTKSHIKILAMTANAFEEDKREALKAGMNGHLAKPINVRELIKALSNTLN